MTKKHEELVEEIQTFLYEHIRVYVSGKRLPHRWVDIDKAAIVTLITLALSAARDGKVEILCPECNEPIKVLKCEGCHLENVDGYIRH